jgi:hypothetical protein
VWPEGLGKLRKFIQTHIEIKTFNILDANIMFGILQTEETNIYLWNAGYSKAMRTRPFYLGCCVGGTQNYPRQIKRFTMHRLLYADRVTISISGQLRWGRGGWARTRDHFNKSHAPFVQYQNILIFTLCPIQNLPPFSHIQINPNMTILNKNILHILRPATSQGYGHVKGLILRQGKHPGIYVCKTCTRDIVGMRHREFRVCEVPQKGGIPR